MFLKFKTAPYDKTARFVTIAPFAIWGGLATSLFISHGILLSPQLAVFLSIILVPYLWAPRYYTVSDQTITIHRLISKVKIAKSAIQSLELIDQAPVKLRLFGSGGLFGYFGLFSLRDGGRAKLYCTRSTQVVIIKTKQHTYIISPEDPAEFTRTASVGAKLKKPKT